MLSKHVPIQITIPAVSNTCIQLSATAHICEQTRWCSCAQPETRESAYRRPLEYRLWWWACGLSACPWPWRWRRQTARAPL